MIEWRLAYVLHILYVGENAPIYPIRRHLWLSLSLPPFLSWALSLALVLRAMREAPRREQTHWDIYTRNIIAADSRHAALVRGGSPCALLPATEGEKEKKDSIAIRKKEKKWSVLSHFDLDALDDKIYREESPRYRYKSKFDYSPF